MWCDHIIQKYEIRNMGGFQLLFIEEKGEG
jgi:hypothetical protein